MHWSPDRQAIICGICGCCWRIEKLSHRGTEECCLRVEKCQTTEARATQKTETVRENSLGRLGRTEGQRGPSTPRADPQGNQPASLRMTAVKKDGAKEHRNHQS